MTLTVFSDTHIGVNRTAGTTPSTQLGLRQHLIAEARRMLMDVSEGDVLFNGDLFDKGNIPMADVLATYTFLMEWLQARTGTLYLSAGNHDLTKSSDVLSSFQFLCAILLAGMPSRVVVISQPTMTPHGYVIPHLANQDLFNLAISNVPACDNLFLHCNYDNNFSVESDQSLNLSKEQAEALPVDNIIIAHEHDHRMALGNKVCIPGNQIASSVADWIGSTKKYYTRITGNRVDLCPVARREDEYKELPWDQLEVTNHKFVKVIGMVAAADTSKVISAVNLLRKHSPAFVISTGVSFVSEDNQSIVENSLDSVTTFSVWDAMEDLFTPQEFAILKNLDKDHA